MSPLADGFPAQLTVGVLSGGWTPFEAPQDGKLTGLSVDYLRALIGPGVAIRIKTYADMPQLLEAACAGKVDVLMSIARTPERERCISFTTPYFRASTAIVVRRDADATLGPTQLADTRLAVEKGFALERLLRARFPRSEVLTYADTPSALRAVLKGDADAYLGLTPAVQVALAAEEFRMLRIAFKESGRTGELRFAVPRARVALRDRLDRALAAMHPADEAAIRTRWLSGNFDMPASAATGRLALTPDEQRWLRALPPLLVGFDNHWAPFSFLDETGHPGGIAADYLDYLGHTLGIVFSRAPGADWPSTITAFQRGELALLATASSFDPRLKNAQPTRAYESYPLVIVGREAEPAARGLDDFASRRIVVSAHGAGSVPPSLLRMPASKLIVAPSLDEALALVANGKADVLVGNVAAVDMLLEQRYAGVLKILGTVGESDAVGFAVRADLAPLAGLIDRALAAMPQAEKQRIRQKWVTGRSVHGTWSVTALRLLPLLIGIGLVLLVTLRGYLLLQREVRLRKKTERELAAQLNFQQTMMEMVPYPLIAKDLAGRYIAINRAYEESTGLRRDAVIGRTAVDIQAWGAANSRSLERVTHNMLLTGERQQIELQFDNAAGDLRHGLFWTSVCEGSDGEPSCVLGTMVDITDIRRAEMRARETERRLFDVTRSLPAVVFQLRRSAAGKYTFPYIGGNTRHLLGGDGFALMKREEIDFDRVCAEDRPLVMAELERSAQHETPIHMEFRFGGELGLKWVRAELVPRREATGGVVWSGYWVDASVEHARSEELARARDLAEAASRAKDDFFAMMSHEIRTPMNGVLGLVEVLERTPLNADQGEMLRMIHESAGALLQILDDLLDYSKIEAGRLTIEAEPVDIRELVDNAVGLLAGRAHEKGLKVRVDVAADVAASVRGDSVRLRQILFNLLGNAIKFTPAGEVQVRVAVVAAAVAGASASASASAASGQSAMPASASVSVSASVSALARAAVQTVEMTVEDTGIGIDPDVQARLFEPFVQAESSTTRRFGGTGLGLTICRQLVALMGGVLELHSDPGVGTRMTVRLAMPVETLRYSVSGLRGKRALVALGDAHVARALEHFGEALGLKMHSVSPGAPELADPATWAGVDLLFDGENVTIPAAVQARPRVICLTEKPKPTGYRILDDNVRVSINPISWRGLGAACAAAMTGLPAVPVSGLPRSAEGGAPPDRERAMAGGRLILVAEDHPVNQELIRHQLALLGFACDVVNDGAEALAALEHTRYGCVVTDCHMPNLSGYELARRIREQEDERRRSSRNGADLASRLPILGITANTAPEDLSLCREAGMDDCLVKPTRLATLRDYLNRWFDADSGRQTGSADAAGTASAAKGGTTRASHAGNAVEPFVPVDLGHMTALWGSESTVKALLDSFVSSVRDDVAALEPLLERVNPQQLREWHHRVAGAAGVLQYPPLLDALESYRRDLTVKTPERLRSEGRALAHQCQAMLNGIEEQAAKLA